MGFFLLMLSLGAGAVGAVGMAAGSSSDDDESTPAPVPTPSPVPSSAPTSPAVSEDATEPEASEVGEEDTPSSGNPGPCPKTGEAVCHCSTEESEAPVANPGPCPKTGEPVCHCHTEETGDGTDDDDSHAGHGGDDDDENSDDTADDDGNDDADHDGHAGHGNNDDDDGEDTASADDDADDGGHAGHNTDDTNDDDAGHAGHGGHGGAEPTIPVPPADADDATIDAYVQAVKSSSEDDGFHADHAGLHAEHMAAMDLVPRDEATHVAIGSGDWNDPNNWHNGLIPDDDAKALIPEGIKLTYSGDNEAELFTLRVDGELDFAADANSTLIVDTFVVSPSGTLTIGTEANPIQDDVDVNIVFANNGPIDTDWDPTLLSRGLISHGKVDIHGQEKDSHEKVIEDPMAGDTSIAFGTIPTGWEVGDTIVIAGTEYEGYYNWEPSVGYSPPEDEERIITRIEDGRVFFDEPLLHDHDTPRDDLFTSVANYSRNVTFETQDADTAEVFERGHVMFMHNNDVEVRFAAFHELGRTDKSEDAFALDDVNNVAFDTNLQGRYSLHFHRTGTQDQDNPAIAEGNAVYGSPGWGFVHHDSHAILENNASYDTFGAGYVAESGNETGAWNDNIAIFAQGVSWKDPKGINAGVERLDLFDFGRSGDGFWFQGRMVESTNNVAASVHNGFTYFHRGENGDTGNIRFDAETSDLTGALHYNDALRPGEHPITGFSGNETFAAKTGLYVLKTTFQQNHDVYSVLEDFTAWSVRDGADLSYTGHYILSDFDLIARDSSSLRGDWGYGINIGRNAVDISIVDSTIEGFETGIDLEKSFTSTRLGDEDHNFVVINTVFTDVDQELENYDPTLDLVLDHEDLPNLAPDIVLDGPLFYDELGTRSVEINGTKTDSLGSVEFPEHTENYSLSTLNVRDQLQENGYYTTSDGQDYFTLDIYFSDRVTGDIYVETHPVFVENTNLEHHGYFRDLEFNGVLDLGGADDPTSDAAELWATITNGELVRVDEASEDVLAEDELEDDVI